MFDPVRLSILTVLLLTPACGAASWFSELWLAPQTVLRDSGPQIVPPLVEVSGLPTATQSELIIIDALNSSSRYGTIKQWFVFPAGSSVRVLSQGPVPYILPAGEIPTPQSMNTLPPGVTFDLTGPRALLLFDRPTGMYRQVAHIKELGDLLPVDVLTLGPTGITRSHPAFPERQPLDPAGWEVLARPVLPDSGLPWDNLFFTGYVSPLGQMHFSAGKYHVNPGLPNESWTPSDDAPEPAVGLIASALAIFLLTTRNRLPHWQSSRHGL